ELAVPAVRRDRARTAPATLDGADHDGPLESALWRSALLALHGGDGVVADVFHDDVVRPGLRFEAVRDLDADRVVAQVAIPHAADDHAHAIRRRRRHHTRRC